MSEVRTIKTTENVMRKVKIGKVVLNIGVGRSGEVLERAKKILKDLTGRKPCYKKAKKTVRDFGIHRGESIATIVTLRGDDALETLKNLLIVKEKRLPSSSFDKRGNCSFGIREHIEIPGMKYDPEIGVFGLDVSVVLERPGYRISRRRRARSKVGKNHIATQDEAIKFFKEILGVDVY
ncbi:MAG: 50S ribosomal protein L5 [Candidatus Methylarchaceae archaeon HK02M1]|nr:50S ribosomal protein L5 [Candidatus Methylarchaceae archaeon HK02M1]